ncbi:MAG: LysM peptidoglycan-binding domain-containing protein [Vallitalea sp.]|jgi:nucleoid-associated protein YgaU|nr:LysM peptidoglycan-binding domain-containing protein [Vallitalea sp.]
MEGLFSINETHYLKSQTLPIDTIKSSMDYVNLIKAWIDNKDIVRVVISKELDVKIDLEFYIESISYCEDGKTVGDILYNIVFREHRQRIFSTINNKALRRSNNKKIINRYTVKEGDYLIKIARKVYGNSSRWKDIYNANRTIIGKNPNLIFPNQVLTIP